MPTPGVESTAQAVSLPTRAAAGGSAYAWWVVAVLCLTTLFAYVDRQIINLLVEPIKRDLGLSDTTISLLQGFAFALFNSLMSLPLGRLADRSSRRNIILVGVACWTLACAGSGLVSTFGALFLMRTLIGFGEATLTPSGYSMLADYFPRERLGRAISLFLGSGFIGSGLAFVAGGWILSRLDLDAAITLPLIGAIHPWQAAFLCAATPGLLCLALLATVREPVRSTFGVPRPVPAPPGMSEVLHFLYLRRRSLGAIYLGFSLLGAMQYGIGSWTPSFFIRTYGWSASQIGYVYGLYYMVLGSTGIVAGGWLTDWLLRRGHADANLRAALIAGSCALPFVVAFPLMPTPRLALLLLAPATFFGTMPFGAGTAALPLLAPNRMRALIVALYLVVANLMGQGLGPTLVASITDFGFGDPRAVRYSISIAAGTLLVMAMAVIASGLGSIGRALEGARQAEH